MKRKNINEVKAEEDTSEDEQQISDDEEELVDEEEESDVDEVEEEGDDDEAEEDDDDEAEEDDGDEEVNDNEDLDASATDSDEDESDNDNAEEDVKPQKSKREKIEEDILKRYQERQGKQLYIRFPHKVPETQEELEEKVKAIAPLVVKVHKPRQKHVRFCLVDFATNDDRNNTLKELKKSIKKGDLEKYVVNIPRTESPEFINDLVERKLKSIENKKAKMRLKKASKKALMEKNFTTTVIVLNLPKTASQLQVRELFPNAVDINIKPGKGNKNRDKSIAAISLPTTKDARNAVKQKLSLGGNQLVIKFDNQKLKKKQKLKENKPLNTTETVVKDESEPATKKPKLEPTEDKVEGKANTMKKQNTNNQKKKPNNFKKFNKNNAKNKTKVGKK